MQTHFDKKQPLQFKVGDIVRAVGKTQVLRVIECKAGMPHIDIEAVKFLRIRCEWQHPNGEVYSEWYDANILEKAR